MPIGPTFTQQIAGTDSVPDGLILQPPLAVFIETKLGSAINSEQLQRHCQTIVKRLPGQKGSLLISLTADEAGQELPEAVREVARKNDILPIAVTFGDLVTNLRKLEISDLALQETIDEFSEFVSGQGLVPRKDQFVAAMLTGRSWRVNADCGVYFEPIERNAKWRRAAFLGLYHGKQISHVGRIIAAIPAMKDYVTGETMFGQPEYPIQISTEVYQRAVRNVIEASETIYPGFASSEHRFYLVDNFSETDFRKVTSGGMMGHRYIDIEEISRKRLTSEASSAEAAQALNGRTFE